MTAMSSLQTAQHRLAHYYLDKLRQANARMRRGHGNRTYWLNLIEQDWGQIKHWQTWSASGSEHDPERARICATFPISTSDILPVRQTTAEQCVWVQQAFEAAQMLGDGETERTLLYQLCSLNLTLEAPDQAAEYARQLAEHAQEAGDGLSLGRAWFVMAAVHFIKGEYDRSEPFLTKSLPLLEACEASREIGQIYLTLGRLANVRGNYQEAHHHYLQYLNSSMAVGHGLAVLQAHLSLCGIYLAMSEYPKAEEHARLAVTMARPYGTSRFLPPALFSLAHAEKALGKFESACVFYEEGIAAARSISSAPSTIANGLHGLGQAKAQQGNTTAALARFEEALTIAREARFLLRVCEVAHDMVFVLVAREEWDAACTRLHDALDSALQLGTPHFMAKALAAAVSLWHAWGKHEQAAVWAGLLTTYIQQVHPSLFDTVVYEELEAELGAERYQRALEQGKTLTLDDTVREILRLLQ